MKDGWLVAQLPDVMRKDLLLCNLVAAFEAVATTVVERIDGVQAQIDLSTAPPEQLRFVASWIGLSLEPSVDDDAQRELVRAVGRTLGARGTRKALEDLLGAATRSRVEVSDRGGIFGEADPVPDADNRISVVVNSLGPLSREQVLAFCRSELPLGSVVDLQVLDDGIAL
jgi:phage tail-like protein